MYACHRVDSAPRQRIFYELYRDRAAFDEHERQDHVRHFLAAREALLESTEVDFLTLADGKTPLPPRPRAAVTDAQLTGERIAYHRKRLGLSQVEFAGLIGRSESWVSQVERGVRAVDRLSVLQKVADALSVPVEELRGEDLDDAAAADRPEAFEELRLAFTGHPAISVVLGSPAQAMTAERLGQLRSQQEQVWEMVHASRYRELAPLIASLIPELEQAVRASAAPELTEAARELLTDTYQAVAAMMAKLGETDAAWIAADRAAFAAEMLHDRLAVAASLFRMAHVFLTLRQTGQAQAVASAALTRPGTPGHGRTGHRGPVPARRVPPGPRDRGSTRQRPGAGTRAPGPGPEDRRAASARTATTSAPSSAPPTWRCTL